MSDRTWDLTYRVKGAVQVDALSIVREAAEVLQSRGANSVLDLCCGTGRHTAYLAHRGFLVHGVDLSPNAIEITRRRAIAENLKNVSLSVGDMRATGLPDQAYDAVICVWSTGHGMRTDLLKTIEEMFRVLKPGGLLLADFPSTEDPHCGKGIRIAERNFLHPFLDHADVPHYYTTIEELRKFIAWYSPSFRIRLIDYPCPKYGIVMKAFWVEAECA